MTRLILMLSGNSYWRWWFYIHVARRNTIKYVQSLILCLFLHILRLNSREWLITVIRHLYLFSICNFLWKKKKWFCSEKVDIFAPLTALCVVIVQPIWDLGSSLLRRSTKSPFDFHNNRVTPTYKLVCLLLWSARILIMVAKFSIPTENCFSIWFCV